MDPIRPTRKPEVQHVPTDTKEKYQPHFPRLPNKSPRKPRKETQLQCPTYDMCSRYKNMPKAVSIGPKNPKIPKIPVLIIMAFFGHFVMILGLNNIFKF